MKQSIGLCLVIVAAGVQQGNSCIAPKALDPGMVAQVKAMLDPAGANPLPYLFLPLADPLIGTLVTTFETPIQFRQAMYHGSACYNTAAMYHPTALDIWGHDDKRICIDDFESQEDMKVHEQIASAYTFAYSAIKVSPGSAKAIQHTMENTLNLPMDNLKIEPMDLGTPWGLARAIVDKTTEYSRSDGWNHNGSLSNEFNKMPFSDFEYGEYKPYENVKSSKHANCKGERFWEPLIESNSNGYFSRQEHVTPFAGYTGRLYGLTTSEYEDFTVSEPDYDYCIESQKVLAETRDMANDDWKKVQIEFYNSKFTSLLPMQIEWSIKRGLSSFDFWFYDMTLVTAMYDATMLVWREKVAFNAIRPTPVIHGFQSDENVLTYAGPSQGAQEINKTDWQPYVRTMPHAEYPSGSTCICTAFAETLQELSGEDAIGPFSIGATIPEGSSRTEPGMTPSRNITLAYDRWSDIQYDCGRSRLFGGMHFSKAIPAGEELCTGLANLVVERAELLKSGNSKGAFADFDDRDIVVKKSANGRRTDEPDTSEKKEIRYY